MSGDTGPDDERDAWLSEALRHAPDALAAPPASVSEAILRQARAATNAARAPVPPSAPSPWAAAWAWLARPPVAVGFASVVVATLVGVMGWPDRPVDRELARAPTPAAASPALTAAPAAKRPASPTPTPTPTTEPEPETNQDAARSLARRDDAAPLAARSLAAAKAAAPAERHTENPVEALPSTLAALRASVGAQPERWGWERSGALRPMTQALQAWLAQLDAATASRWRTSPDAPASGEAEVLRLYRDGKLAATLRLDAQGVGLVAGPRAALPPATMARLKQALDDATR